MKVILDCNSGTCLVEAEPNDPKFYGIKNAAGKSRLLYHIKQVLNSTSGRTFIKKRMWKDGHLVDDMQQYLREAKSNSSRWCIWNDRWAIEGADEVLRRDGRVSLRLVNLIAEGEQNG